MVSRTTANSTSDHFQHTQQLTHPPVQSLQTVAPVVSWYWPFKQLVHSDDDDVGAYWPMLHVIHVVEPAVSVYLPAAQDTQDEEPVKDWYLPVSMDNAS